MPNGAWRVYRFSPGITETDTWTQDGQGWTTCYFNRYPDLATACTLLGGVEREQGGYVFSSAEKAVQAAKNLGEELTLPDDIGDRKVTLKAHKDGRLVVEIERRKNEAAKEGWDDKSGKYVKIFKVKADPKEEDGLDFNEFDKIIRAVKTPAAEHSGWMLKEEGKEWTRNPASNVKMYLQGQEHPKAEAEAIMGVAVGRSWKLVNLPFREEYPGGRQWNMDAAQFKYKPAELADDEVPCHPHWDMIFNHIGHELTPKLRELPWAIDANIRTGADYLRAWVACAFRDPFQPLPYLFFFGPEDCGKSIFYEALQRLVTKGVVEAKRALTSEFNKELSARSSVPLKKWTFPKPPASRQTQGVCHRANHPNPQDAPRLLLTTQRDSLGPDGQQSKKLSGLSRRHAHHDDPGQRSAGRAEDRQDEDGGILGSGGCPFPLYAHAHGPATGHRPIALPVVMTASKEEAQEANQTLIEQFIAECCEKTPERHTLFSEFYDSFQQWLPPSEKYAWSKKRVSRELPIQHSVRIGHGNQKYVSHVTLEPAEEGK